ncbi:L-threonylcarbamoyladenylate synthase [Teredinibacter purpureus]|uniref:L-threonylcarbamoyladenylate synthase n=1 Tax=Teredinibacter purpureus TaxID=2731756 RepID=UPI0005F7963B|nr:Sua5/YciO/YrdC/YwlC family protein [Teredinibacter purpureus]
MDYRYHPATIRCVAELNAGGVIAYPTEAVWGLGCDPWNGHAVKRILQLKHRRPEKGLILVASHTGQFGELLQALPPEQKRLLEQSWPGHITWLIPHRNAVPENVHGAHDTIAVRVSAHPVVKALCDKFGGPIVSTSANPQALPPAKNGTTVRRYFGRSGITVAAGTIGGKTSPSIIRDLASGTTLRG